MNDERRMDIEANLFAMELLMPKRFLHKDLRDKRVDIVDDEDKVVQWLAKKYGVSVHLMTFRLGVLYAARLR